MLKSKPRKEKLSSGKSRTTFSARARCFLSREHIFELFCKADSDDCKKKRLSERGTPKVFGGKLFCLDTKTFPFHNRFDMPNADVKN